MSGRYVRGRGRTQIPGCVHLRFKCVSVRKSITLCVRACVVFGGMGGRLHMLYQVGLFIINSSVFILIPHLETRLRPSG